MGGRTSPSHTDAVITGVAGAYAMIHAVTNAAFLLSRRNNSLS